MLTGDSFFHLSALGEPLPGLNLCGAGRVVCLIDPVGDVYACPFVLHDEFKAGSVRDEGGFAAIWRSSDLFTSLREPSSPGACGSCGSYDACGGGCMAAKFFTGLPLDAPDPECVFGHGEEALKALEASGGAVRPTVSADHSKPVGVGRKRIPVTVLDRHRRPERSARRGAEARERRTCSGWARGCVGSAAACAAHRRWRRVEAKARATSTGWDGRRTRLNLDVGVEAEGVDVAGVLGDGCRGITATMDVDQRWPRARPRADSCQVTSSAVTKACSTTPEATTHRSGSAGDHSGTWAWHDAPECVTVAR